MEFCKATLTFKSVDEILRCDHSNESTLSALSHSAICFSKLYKMKFANLLKICLWLHLAVKGLIKLVHAIWMARGWNYFTKITNRSNHQVSHLN